jgi:hypothetical protein
MFKTYIGITRIYFSPLYIIYVHRTGIVLSVNFFRINDDTVVGFKCKTTVSQANTTERKGYKDIKTFQYTLLTLLSGNIC